MMWRFIVILCSCVPMTAFSSYNQINELQIKSYSKYCQITIAATSPIHYRLMTLSNPDRVVVDIDNAHLVRLFNRSLLQGTPIRDIRSGYHDNNKLRIVFDLKSRAATSARVLPPSHYIPDYRLKLSLNWQASPSFLAPPQVTSRPRYQFSQPANPVEFSPMPIRSKKVIVVIDPGHGGKDPGATGPRGIREKNVVLQISKNLQRDINRLAGFQAYLTRDGDYYLTLRERLAIARHYKADMFIAIHADAYRGHRAAYGASIFALSQRGATSEAARWLARRENESELMGGVDLTDKNNLLKSVLINLSQTATVRASLNIGQDLIQSLGDVGTLHHHRIEQAAFVVLKSPDIPSLLVETGFITNPVEEKKLTSASYQKRLANALMQGIRAYFIHSPPRGTWLAQQKRS